MLGQDWSLVIFNIRRRVIYRIYLTTTSSISHCHQKKNILSCRRYSKITDSTVWPCCNPLCRSWIYLFSCSANVRIPCLEQINTTLAKHSPLPARNKIEPNSFHSEFNHWLATPSPTHGEPFVDLSRVLKLRDSFLQKDSRTFYPLRHMLNRQSKGCHLGPICAVDDLCASPGLF